MNTETTPMTPPPSALLPGQIRRWARVTLELLTPVHIGTGREEDGSDAGVVRDANGLPGLPGSSLAGVLRSALTEAQALTNEEFNKVFGYQDSTGQGAQRRGVGQGSRLCVSWGEIHNQHDQPVEGLVEPDDLEKDAVLRTALRPTWRDHVALNGRGVASGNLKFDERVVQAGHRFTFDLELLGAPGAGSVTLDDKAWTALFRVLRDPRTRLGGKSRRGLGRFKVVRVAQNTFNLGLRADFDAYVARTLPAATAPGPEETSTDSSTIYVVARPRFFWMMGGGADAQADLAPVRDQVIRWTVNANGQVEGKPEEAHPIPGSALKGVLRHRFLYHARLESEAHAEAWQKQIFGWVAEEKTDGVAGQPGQVMVDDQFVPHSHDVMAMNPAHLPEARLQHHVAIDRFTGGAREGLLFTEKPLYTPDQWLVLPIHLSSAAKDWPDGAKRALRAAVADLAEGRLPIGGGVGRGLGALEGTASFPPLLDVPPRVTPGETP
jgi:CRISPR/Cas system CSM-associated protein Csm3 (group 7 of RAMP superfamily)